MYEYIYYIILFVVVIIVFIYIYIRLKYGFWFYQPVFHIYNFKYYLFPPGIIDNDLPKENKYTNFKSIETLQFNKVSDLKMNKFINFIQLHYLQNKNNQFLPNKNNIIPYFTGLNSTSFFSFYYEDILLQDPKTNTPIQDKKIISVMTSRPIHIFINNGSKDANFDAYYVDYLCVDKNYRKKGIAPEIIQTHHYNQRHLNKNISVSLFKREGELTGIVPLCVFLTYCFETKCWNNPSLLQPEYNVIETNPKNIQFVVDFLREKSADFDITIMQDLSNILELIKTGNMFIYFVLYDNNIQSIYYYRKTCIYIDINKKEEALTCFVSINNFKNEELFIQGYKIALYKIIEKHKNFKCAVIENISHNNIIIKNITKKTKPIVISPTAYFFYNFAYPTFKPEKVLFIC